MILRYSVKNQAFLSASDVLQNIVVTDGISQLEKPLYKASERLTQFRIYKRNVHLSFHPSAFTLSCKALSYYELDGLTADTYETESDIAEIRENHLFLSPLECPSHVGTFFSNRPIQSLPLYYSTTATVQLQSQERHLQLRNLFTVIKIWF